MYGLRKRIYMGKMNYGIVILYNVNIKYSKDINTALWSWAVSSPKIYILKSLRKKENCSLLDWIIINKKFRRMWKHISK
jgi:hypothetical protein